MNINFQQGIIAHPATGTTQQFLTNTGQFVNLLATTKPVDVAFVHGYENYLFSETADVGSAWGPITANTDAWLYWNIDLRTSVRTFGVTYLQPYIAPTQPSNPLTDQHWFNTTNRTMYVYGSGVFQEVVRVFAAKVNNTTFTPLGSGNSSAPFTGTQVGLTTPNVSVGRILVDNASNAIRRLDGKFITTESDIFVNGSPISTVRLESTVVTGTALENMGKFFVVKYQQFGKLALATYEDTSQTAIAMLLQDLATGQTGAVCLQGQITNTLWNWTVVGAPLWITGSGSLTLTDPRIADPVGHPNGRPPVGRVLTPTSIFFDQGLGGKGDKGDPATQFMRAAATDTVGLVKLSVNPIDPAEPVVVSTNDPRMTNARTPTTHTQAATTIIPTQYKTLAGSNLQLDLQIIEDGKVARAGDTMLGDLTLFGPPSAALHATSKTYVDTQVAAVKTTVNVFTKNQSVGVAALTDGASIAVDASLSNNFKVTLGGNRALANPTNLTEGMILNFAIMQDGTGGRTLAYGSLYKFPGGTLPVLSTAANAKDFMSCYYDGAALLCNMNKGFA